MIEQKGSSMAAADTKAQNGAKTNGAQTGEVEDARGFEIPRPAWKYATLSLQGISPLIMHRWTEKAVKMLEGSQTGKAKAQKEARRPEEEAYDCAYIVPGKEKAPDSDPEKFYFPAPAFKHAYLYGVSQLDDVRKFPKTKAVGWVFIDGDPFIVAESITMRTDTGRIGQGTATMVYRLSFSNWTAELPISYNSRSLTVEQIAALFELGGVGGIGEWRPTSPKNKSGDFGRFRVVGVTERRAPSE